MADVEYREPNQVKWLGYRPGHRGDQVIEYNNVSNGNQTVYTVPSGKTFFLTGWTFTANASATGVNAFFNLRNAGGGLVLRWHYIHFDAVGQVEDSRGLMFPIEIPEDYYIEIATSAATVDAHCTVWGWVE